MKMRYPGIFVIGTDTEVGKTYVSCMIADILRRSGIEFGVCKPFASGSREDVVFLKRFSGVDDDINSINPLIFKYPLAPSCSAALERKGVDLKKAVSAISKLKRKYPFVIVEGIGGLMVPLNKKELLVDFIKKIGFPVVIVARSGLGTINHTVLTHELLKQRRIKTLGVIYNRFKGKTLDEKVSFKEIERITGLRTLAKLGEGKKLALRDIKWLVE